MCFLFILFFQGVQFLFAQNNRPYHINGNAFSESCNCYTLTTDQTFQSGSVWNINKIDLNTSFTYTFDVFLGCNDEMGADGIAFVLQPVSTSIGSSGGGMGVEGIVPSLIIAIDTWQNEELADPAEDHIAIQLNGDLNHNSANNIAGPVSALANSNNIEDCQWHIFKITWDAVNKKITAFIDGVERVSAQIDLVQKVFNGDPKVFWGFSGATGGASNLQRFCTSLNAAFSFPKDQITCYPELIRFQDSSTTFGAIEKWYWNFGDGTKDSVQTPAPHLYPHPGNYNVTLNILGNDGCVSDTFRLTVVAGSKPVADFDFDTGPYCDDKLIPFVNKSEVNFGTINEWHWQIDGAGQIRTDDDFSQKLSTGDHQVSLTVKTREGCISYPVAKTIRIFEHPEIRLQPVRDACKGVPVAFEAYNAKPSVPVQQWYWNLGDQQKAYTSTASHSYADTGRYTASIYGLSNNGCSSDTLQQHFSIFGTYANAGRDTIAAKGQPIQLLASGGKFYAWQPATGLSDASSASPIAILTQDQQYVLTATTDVGCPSYDTLLIKVYAGPEFYVPNAFSPNNDRLNDVFRFKPVGMRSTSVFRVYNRLGQMVFQSNSPEKGWDGTYNKTPQEAGVYVWMIEGIDYNGVKINRKGTVSLIR